MSEVAIRRAAPSGAQAQNALRAYYDDIISRYYQRPAESAEVDAVMKERSHDELLLPPHGLLLVACRRESVLGCVGLRILGDIGEVTRLHVTTPLEVTASDLGCSPRSRRKLVT
ncbi:hypothetical protein [Kineococcus siccus]|uniref:hypothetical protein n=1 Tax=Kineococcus siccus TaxID=2696567 RepID=UPI0030B83FCC